MRPINSVGGVGSCVMMTSLKLCILADKKLFAEYASPSVALVSFKYLKQD